MSATAAKVDVLDDLRERFLDEGRQEMSVVEDFAAGRVSHEKARDTVHRWVGTAALLGYFELSDLATQLESAILAGCNPAAEHTRNLIDGIRSHLGPGSSPAAADSPGASPIEDPAELLGSRVGLLGFTSPESDPLIEGFEAAGASCRRAAAGQDEESLSAFDLLVIRVDSSGVDSPQVQAGLEAPSVRLWTGENADVCSELARRAETPADFLIEPCREDELILRAAILLKRRSSRSEPVVLDGEGKPQVVLADDDPIVTAILEATLVEQGFVCSSARDGEETIELIRKIKPDAAVVDVMMPRRTGFEVLEELRNDPATQATPVILLTARRQEADVLRGFGLGAADYVVKPFRPVEVLARLQRLVGKKNSAEEH